MKNFAIVLTGMLISTGVLADKPPKDDATVICPCAFETVYGLYSGSACNVSYTETKGKYAEHNLTWFNNDGYSYFAGVIKGAGAYACTTSRTKLADGSGEDLALGLVGFDSRKAFSVCAAELEAIYEESLLSEEEFCEAP